MSTGVVKTEDVPDEGQGVVVSAVELSRMINTTRENVLRMVHQGCPVVQKGAPGGQPTLIALGPWFRWIQLRARTASGGGRPGGSVGGARERKMEADAATSEFKLEVLRGKYVNREEMQRKVLNWLTNMHEPIRTLDGRLMDAGYDAHLARKVYDFMMRQWNIIAAEVSAAGKTNPDSLFYVPAGEEDDDDEAPDLPPEPTEPKPRRLCK